MKNIQKLDGLNSNLIDFLFELDNIVQKKFIQNGITLSSGIRTYEEQKKLWENRFKNPYPVSHPDKSNSHYDGNAIDVSMDEFKSKWALFVPTVRTLLKKYPSIIWGIDWNPSDPVHFQIKESKSIVPFLLGTIGIFLFFKFRKK